MKRLALVLGILLCALVGFGAVVAAQTSARPTPPLQQPVQRLVGYAGKIMAVKPPGDWTSSGSPVNLRPAPNPARPLVLPVFGTDINAMSSNETFIASDPQNPLNFISGSNLVARAFSSDGGQTWTTTNPDGIGDPSGVYDDAGNAYFAQLSTGNCPDPAVVSRSPDGGATWGEQVEALSDPSPGDHLIDKEWLAADTSASSPFHGRIYVTATSFFAPGCILNAYINDREVLAYSTDQGATWSPSITLSDASHNQDQSTNPAVASNGTLYVAYQYQNCTFNCATSIPMYQLLTRSTDGGVTFSPSITVTGQPISPTGAFISGSQYLLAISTSTGFRHNDQQIIGISPTNPNVIYSLWTDGRWDTSFVYQGVTGQHADIAFSRSTDGGTTWAAPIKVNDLPNGDGTDQFFPWMAVGSDGVLHASWMDRRADGFQYREYYSQSTDGGLTWAANIPVADMASTPRSFIGDYTGLAVNANNTLVLPVWTDLRGSERIYTDRGILVPGTPTPTVTGTPLTVTPTPIPRSPTLTSTPTSTQTALAVTETRTATRTPNTPTPTETPCPISFSDVHTTDYFYVPVQYLYCHGAISGYSDNTFRPFNNTTRGQLSKIIVLAEGWTIDTTGGPHFSDVPTTDTFYQYIETAYNHTIISGYSDGTFRPGNNVTRAQLSKIVVSAETWAIDTTGGPHFSDVPTTDTFYGFIETAYNHTIISGYSDGTFRPGAYATRGQILKIIYNAVTSP